MSVNKTQLNINGFNVPVTVNSVASRSRISFKNCCPDCDSSIKQKRVCKNCEDEVEYGELKKGYKLGDKMYTFDKEVIKKIKDAASGDTMELQKVIDRSEIDLTRAQKSYYLGAEEGATQKYAVLKEALDNTDNAVIVKYKMRSRPAPYAIWSNGNGLVMTKLSFPDDVKEQEPFDEKISDDMKQKAVKLIKKAREDTQSNVLVDDYRQELEGMLEKVVDGEDVSDEAESTAEKKQEMAIEDELEDALSM